MRTLLIMAIAATVALGLPAADVAGTWKGSMETQMGTTGVTITLQSGAPITGKVQIGEYDSPIEKAEVDGDKIGFEINIGPGKVSFQGTVSGDDLKFNVAGTQGSQYTLVCKRQK